MRVLITGANRGIGAALRQRYDANGAEVWGTHRDATAGRMLSIDVADPAAGDTLRAAFGSAPLDLLVCNAGIYLDQTDDIDSGYEAAKWAQTFAVNVTGVFLTVQGLLPNLRAAEGKVAIISSQMGSHMRNKGRNMIYRASKAAAINLGRNLSTALKPDGIAVGIYHPGWVQTDMGGQAADITVDEAVSGLMDRFRTLSLSKTGCFETWDGRTHPY